MSKLLDQLNTALGEFEKSPQGFGIQLRLDLAEIIWSGLQRRGWSQGQLAKRAGLKDSVVSNLIHGNKNCTLDTVGRVVHALGTRAFLRDDEDHLVDETSCRFVVHSTIINATDQNYEDLRSEQTEINIKVESTG